MCVTSDQVVDFLLPDYNVFQVPTEWAAVPAHNFEVAIIMDPDPEQSQEEVPDDASRPSYREEEPQLAASDVFSPSRQRH